MTASFLTTIRPDTLKSFQDWVMTLELKPNLLKTNDEERDSIWVKLGSNLSPLKPIRNEKKGRHRVLLPKSGLVIEPTERADTFFTACMNKAYNNPLWHSALVSNGWCKFHREHSIFNWGSIIIPVYTSVLVVEKYDKQSDSTEHNTYSLEEGDIWWLNCKDDRYKFDGYVVQVFTFKANWEEYIPEKNMMAI